MFKYNIILNEIILYKKLYMTSCRVKFHVFGLHILIGIILCSWTFLQKSRVK